MLLKRGQVTVFMILGIVLLATVMFLIYVVSEIQLGELSVAQEKVVSKTFHKEALRIFVEDCLTDSLEEGLIKIGEQGRLWSHDVGGSSSLVFDPGVNGITFINVYGNQTNLFYGLTYEEDLMYPNSYPCDNQTNVTPAFCKYSYPESADFGQRQNLKKNAIKADLDRYMTNKSIECVKSYLESNLSISRNVVQGEIKIDVDIENEGFEIDVEYPLELVVEDETYFHLIDFSFFYPSEFQTFFTHAISNPLNIRESRNVTYSYTEDELKQEASYIESITFNKFNVSDGDTVLWFHLPAGIILKHDDYDFWYAIENRPPALDYISRDACIGYDYLAIAGDETEYGEINITPNALDPDNDNVSYGFESSDFSLGYVPIDNFYYLVQSDFAPGLYNLTVSSKDDDLYDWQDVRVLVDRPIDLNITLATPYENYSSTTGVFTVSVEDPVYITLTMPEESMYSEAFESMGIIYDGRDNGENFTINPAISAGATGCFSLPNIEGQGGYICDASSYDSLIDNWNILSMEFPYFNTLTSILNGKLKLEFSTAYCGSIAQSPETEEVNVQVVQCLDFEGLPGHIYPYVPQETYHHIVVNESNISQRFPDEEISRFLAPHICCNQNVVQNTDTECYRGEPGCYGKIVYDWTPGYPEGYILEERVVYCDGNRGNTCEGESTHNLYRNENDEVLICGSDEEGCLTDNIPDECEGQLAWGFTEYEQQGAGMQPAWCHGTMGCSDICKKDENAIVWTGDGDAPNIREEVSRVQATEDNNLNFVCGCQNADELDPCDNDMDGIFEGSCSGGSCS